MGVGLGYSLIAYESLLRGLSKLELDADRLQADLVDAWELLAEPVQTVMRRFGIAGAYEQLKQLTRGRGISAEQLRGFIEQLEIPPAAQSALLNLTPLTYLGNAAQPAPRLAERLDELPGGD